LLVVDGDFVSRSWLARLLSRIAPKSGHAMAERHRHILSRVYFSNGARADAVAALLCSAGFADIKIDFRLRPIHRAQRNQLGWRKSLTRRSEHRYAISASKPLQS
jgi:hypothetical protein